LQANDAFAAESEHRSLATKAERQVETNYSKIQLSNEKEISITGRCRGKFVVIRQAASSFGSADHGGTLTFVRTAKLGSCCSPPDLWLLPLSNKGNQSHRRFSPIFEL
jgi:hypothetical protein